MGRKVLATGCIAMAVLHRGLHFKGENQDDDHDRNWVIRDLGNINENTSGLLHENSFFLFVLPLLTLNVFLVSFSFAFRPKNECDLSGLGRLPIQMQFLYTGEDGSQVCLKKKTLKHNYHFILFIQKKIAFEGNNIVCFFD